MKTLIRDVSVSRNGLKEKLKNDLNRFAEETTFSQNGKSPDFISRSTPRKELTSVIPNLYVFQTFSNLISASIF